MGALGPRLKYIQGSRHLAHLWHELLAYESEGAQELKLAKRLVDGRIEAEWVVTRLERMPSHWSLLIGDVINNLRAALDHAVWHLAASSLGEKVADRKRNEISFPIRLDAAAFDKDRVLPHLTKTVQSVLHSHQPFVRQPANPKQDPLAALHEAWNVDKHRSLHLVTRVSKATEVTTTPKLAVDPEITFPTAALAIGQPAVRMTAPWGGGLRDVKLDLELMIEIGFGGEGRLVQVPLQAGLDAMRARVDAVLTDLGFLMPVQPDWVDRLLALRP